MVFWVCWVLKQLFAEPSFNERIVFKGGTSLSKVFGLIDRFSEDIDLVLDWRLLGYGAGMEHPRQELDSLTKRDRFSKAVNRKAAEYIAGTLIHDLTRLMARCPQVSAVVDVIDPHSVNISYPASFSVDYIRPEVVLEIGPLASWVPSASHGIRPYAAEEFPQLFAEPEFRDLVVLRVDFDAQKDIVKKFGVQMQSTLIVFQGNKEVGRSVGDTNAGSIQALLTKAV